MYVGFILSDPRYHCTVGFNGKFETKLEYKRAVLATAAVANGWELGPLALRFEDEMGYFEGANVWYAQVINPQIGQLHTRLIDMFKEYQVFYKQDFDYIPHVTVSKAGFKPETNPYLRKLEMVTKLSVISYEFGKTHLLL